MQYRAFPRTDWQVSEIGYGMWGMGGWSGSDDEESLQALDRAVARGCNFFDTAWIYGNGRSERLLGQTLRAHRRTRLYAATKIPPKNLRWPGRAGDPLDATFPLDHIREYTEHSLRNLDINCLDLQQLHVWSDTWADDERWQRAAEELKRQGLIRAFGISVNRWEPHNVLKALNTGVVDCVQVVYNIFDQAPEDELFRACERLNVAIIARVPFDEGSLTGTLTADTQWPEGDWRNVYFTPANLAETLPRVDQLRKQLSPDMALAELALRFILQHPSVTTTIPGMRRVRHVDENLDASDGRRLPRSLYDTLKAHRWDRAMVIE